MTDTTDFIKEQDLRYDDFRKAALETKKDGLKADPNLEKKMGGFYIVLKHRIEIIDPVEKFSREIASNVPAIIYGGTDVHTTLGSYSAKMGMIVDPRKPKHEETLERMSWAVLEAIQGWKDLSIDYTEYLHTSCVAIALGIPSPGFVKLVNRLVLACKKREIDLKPAWGAHITLSRFKANVPAKKLKTFFRLFKETPPLGKSSPVIIGVGYSRWTPQPDEIPEDVCGHFTAYRIFFL